MGTSERQTWREADGRDGLSLIEILVVLFIIGILLSLLLPAVMSVRHRMQATACQNNVRQVSLALGGFVHTKKEFPKANRWSMDILKWMEEWPLADAIEANTDPNADFPRPRLFRCPMQDDFLSRVPGVGVCHYVLIVGRPVPQKADRVRWEIHDRQALNSEVAEEPWYIAPELNFLARDRMIAHEPGPHPPGLYMTARGHLPR